MSPPCLSETAAGVASLISPTQIGWPSSPYPGAKSDAGDVLHPDVLIEIVEDFVGDHGSAAPAGTITGR